MVFCGNCGASVQEGTKFCPNCGKLMQPGGSSTQVSQESEDVERAFFKGEGELVVKRTEHRGAGRKMASFLAGGPIGYVARER